MTEQEFNPSEYDLPTGDEVVVDAANDKIVDIESMTPYERIKATAQEQGIEIREPKAKCGRCYGRGYTALDSKSKMPLPCSCIFNEEQKQQLHSVPLKKGRKLMRKQEKEFRNQITRAALGRSPTKKKVVSKRKKK